MAANQTFFGGAIPSNPFTTNLQTYGNQLRNARTPAPTSPAPVVSAFSPRGGFSSIGRAKQAEARDNAAAREQGSGNSYLDMIMSLLGGTGGGGGGGGYGAQISALQDRGAQDRARIEALYKSYGDMIGARRGDIEGNYATGTQNLTNAYNQAASTNQAAFDAARQAQTRQLQQLGLTEMAPPTNTEAQVAAAQETEKLKQAALAQQEANRQAAVNQNISLQNAASREGTSQLASFDQRLSDLISQMQMGGGGGGGGGGGASTSDIIRAYLGAAELDMKQQDMETEKQIRAAELAQGGQTQDWAGLYQQLIDQYQLDPEVAIKLLGLY